MVRDLFVGRPPRQEGGSVAARAASGPSRRARSPKGMLLPPSRCTGRESPTVPLGKSLAHFSPLPQSLPASKSRSLPLANTVIAPSHFAELPEATSSVRQPLSLLPEFAASLPEPCRLQSSRGPHNGWRADFFVLLLASPSFVVPVASNSAVSAANAFSFSRSFG